ncbi:unnamed protein product [Acanthoscelides obtectus]|uniref:Transposase n=1 Tax=Acanthoscelides obtectus TaxID=200917 RepID=A0A9P0JY91_ACAOB|nr:unnamed protein product [Acanthoscelides obtectus]CAK1639080.1 Histone-lysine N-methyltransferase SETMAR [Acanthoscelides obtectus]
MELNREHFRAIIYYNFQRQLSQQECLAELLSVFGNEAPHQSTISSWYGEFKCGTAVTQEDVDAVRKLIIEDIHVTYREIEACLKISKTSIQKILHEELGVRKLSTISRWYGEFKRGRVSLSDDPRVGAPKTAVTQENVDAERKLIIEDRHVTYREIEASLKISKTSIHEELGVRKLVSRWISHLLTEEQKAARVNWSLLVVMDRGFSVFQGEEKPTKVIRSRSVSKKMLATFVSKAGHIQSTVTADWYTTICLPKVITELRKINPERRIILHQDNASSHTAQKTRQYLTEENVELLDHPPYSPDLSPNDFFTFPKFKNRLRGQRVQWSSLDLLSNEWNKCFENWFERVEMCINLRGEYFEKQ